MNEEIEFSVKIVHDLVEEVGELLIIEDSLMHQHAEIMDRRQRKSKELWDEIKRLAELRRAEKYSRE